MNQYVTSAATRLLPIIHQIMEKQAYLTVADVWANSKAADILYDTNTGMLSSERGPAIVAAFRLAGLRPTSDRVANTNGAARYRKVAVWQRA
jgi:hypothetical protein